MVDTIKILEYLLSTRCSSDTRMLEAVNNQVTASPRPGPSSSCFEGQNVGIAAVGELIWSELM
jgi:hypothetical protein